MIQIQSLSIRSLMYAKMRAAFGEPEVANVACGELYRWTLVRSPYGLNMYITWDSPERDDLAHITVSDDTNNQPQPLVSTIVYTRAEADALVQRLRRQWKHPASRGWAAERQEPFPLNRAG